MSSVLSWIARALALLGALAASMGAHAAVIFDTSDVLTSNAQAQSTIAQAREFTVVSAGAYEFELVDENLPQRLQSVTALLIRGDSVVSQLDLQGSAPAQAQVSFQGDPGIYRIHVFGQPASSDPQGTFRVRVRSAGASAALFEFSDALTSEAAPRPSGVTASFQVSEPGDYEVQITDRMFPVALSSIEGAVLFEGTMLNRGSAPSFTFTSAQAGTHTLALIAEASSAGGSGLYSVAVRRLPSGPVVYRTRYEVGTLPQPRVISIPVTGTHSLSLSDAQFPQSLTSFRVLLVQNDVVGESTGGTNNVNLGAGEVKIYSSLVASAGVGAIRMRLERGGSPVYADVLLGDADSSPSSPSIFSIPIASLGAGDYSLATEDFAVPAALTSLRTAVAQGDGLINSWIGEGARTFTAAAGSARILVAAAPTGPVNNGIFGVRLQDAGGATLVESNQGVGGLSRSQVIEIPAAGSYDIRLTDLGVPANLDSAILAVTRGTTLVGQVFGGGQLRTQLQPGQYVINFIGRPSTATTYGAYAVQVEDSPPQPTITLTANPTSVNAGQTATLQWSTTNATSCTSANGWTGSRAVSGTFTTSPLNVATTFELNCSGPGGSATATTTVNINSASGRGGGGGSVGLTLLVSLLVIAASRSFTSAP